MTIDENKYRRLKQEVEDATAEAERARGALTQLLTQLEEDFKCGNLKEAKSLLTQLENKRDKAAEQFETALADYERKWKQK